MESFKIDLEKIVDNAINELFYGTNKELLMEDDSIYTRNAKRRLVKAFQNYYDRNDANRKSVQSLADIYGINLDKGKARDKYVADMLAKNKGSYEKSLQGLGPELKNAANILRNGSGVAPQPDVNDEIEGNTTGLQRARDMMDKMSLTPMYDQERAKEAGINKAPFGTEYITIDKNKKKKNVQDKPKPTPAKPALVDDDGNVTREAIPEIPADKVVGYDYRNLDLSKVPDAEIKKYFKGGTRQRHLIDKSDMPTSLSSDEKDMYLNYFNEYWEEHKDDFKKKKKEKENSENADGKAQDTPADDDNTIDGPTYKFLAQMADAGDEKALETIKNLYYKAEFNKLMNSKFGYDFKIPGAMYTYGNSKLPKDTLVINFTTAHRCPAWNECLVGYACYARGSEHNYEGLHRKNSNLNLMWMASRKDPEIMSEMLRIIKTYLVNPAEMAKALLNDERTRDKWIGFLKSGDRTFNPVNKATNNAMQMPKNPLLGITTDAEAKAEAKAEKEMMGESRSILGTVLENLTEASSNKKLPKGANANLSSYIYESNWREIFSEEDLEVIKANPKVFRARFIRLNEEGDFIGQWLLDEFDIFAGELKLLGISTAAYTCRNLNFEKLENIIINASTTKVGANNIVQKKDKNGKLVRDKDGKVMTARTFSDKADDYVSSAIARRFFAVSPELYNKLEDTYVPSGNKLDYQVPSGKIKKGDYDGSKPFVPLHKMGNDLHVKYDLKRFTLNGESNPVTFNDYHDKNGRRVKERLYYKCPCGRHGDVLDGNKPIKMDCYLCRMCYEPKNEDIGEVYVLVEVHGDNTDSFDMKKANKERGLNDTMATYKEAREIFGNRLSENTKIAEKLGIKAVMENGINSVKNRLADIAEREFASMKTESKNFSDLMRRINEVERNNRGERIYD